LDWDLQVMNIFNRFCLGWVISNVVGLGTVQLNVFVSWGFQEAAFDHRAPPAETSWLMLAV